MRTGRVIAIGAIAAVATVGAAGCGSGDGDGSTGGSSQPARGFEQSAQRSEQATADQLAQGFEGSAEDEAALRKDYAYFLSENPGSYPTCPGCGPKMAIHMTSSGCEYGGPGRPGGFTCFATAEGATEPYCCNRGADFQWVPINWTPSWKGDGPMWIHFHIQVRPPGRPDQPGKHYWITCQVPNRASNVCRINENQKAELTGKEGGPMDLYVGESRVFGLKGYLP